MKKRLPLFSSHLSVGIAEDKLDSLEKITLSRAIPPNDDIMFRRKRFGGSLIFVAVHRYIKNWSRRIRKGGFHSPLETLNYDLLDVHCGSGGFD